MSDFSDYSKILNSTIRQIAQDEGFKGDAEITYGKGTDKGDGYSGVHIAVDVKGDDDELKLFVKKTNDEILRGPLGKFVLHAYNVESNFYENVAPTLLEFQSEKNIPEPFNNIPKWYKTVKSEDSFVIVLENLRARSFDLHDRRVPMDHQHILLAFKTFARFHALSYAIKDQKPDQYKVMTENMPRTDSKVFKDTGFEMAVSQVCDKFISDVRKRTDFFFQSRCKSVKNNALELLSNLGKAAEDKRYATITQGDCWCNNMMFRYLQDRQPDDICLIDFQLSQINSPVFDLSYFFFVAADKESLAKLDYYLNYYYHHLSTRVKELGSNPGKLYPRHVFKQDWKKFSLYGLSMATMVVKAMLMAEDEIVDLTEGKSFGDGIVTNTLAKEEEYIKRMTALFEHFINAGYT